MTNTTSRLATIRTQLLDSATHDVSRRTSRRRAVRRTITTTGAASAIAATAFATTQLGTVELSGTTAKPVPATEQLPAYAQSWEQVRTAMVCGSGGAHVIFPGAPTSVPASMVPPLDVQQRLSPELAGCRDATDDEVTRLNQAGAAGTLVHYRIGGDNEVLWGLPAE